MAGDEIQLVGNDPVTIMFQSIDEAVLQRYTLLMDRIEIFTRQQCPGRRRVESAREGRAYMLVAQIE